MKKFTLDIILPVFNEAETIVETLRTFHHVLKGALGDSFRFIICEDGSNDGTESLLRELQRVKEFPLLLSSSKERKGYSKAIRDGFALSNASMVALSDTDGQYDPLELLKFISIMEGGKTCPDLIIGHRVKRADPAIRRMISTFFKWIYNYLFFFRVKNKLKDPSCAFFMIKKESLDKILLGNMGLLKNGLCWEICARAQALDFKIQEIPIIHKNRIKGNTKVFLLLKLPLIAFDSFVGLWRLYWELKIISR